MVTLQERMNRLFEDSMARSKTTDEEMAMGAWTPSVDIFETPEKVVLRADLPGVAEKEIDLRIENSMLTLRGERRFLKETKEEDYHRIERSYGSFSRSFQLPGTIDQEGIQATHKDGVLEVVLPKREETRPKHIKVDVKK
jgi:HSP20 family protein